MGSPMMTETPAVLAEGSLEVSDMKIRLGEAEMGARVLGGEKQTARGSY